MQCDDEAPFDDEGSLFEELEVEGVQSVFAKSNF